MDALGSLVGVNNSRYSHPSLLPTAKMCSKTIILVCFTFGALLSCWSWQASAQIVTYTSPHESLDLVQSPSVFRREAQDNVGVDCNICRSRCAGFNPKKCDDCNMCPLCSFAPRAPQCKNFCKGNDNGDKIRNCLSVCNRGIAKCQECQRVC